MSDLRALVTGRDIALSDGAYVERRECRPLALEEWLRGSLTRGSFCWPGAKKRFLEQAAVCEPALRETNDDTLKAALFEVAQQMKRRGFKDALLAKAFAVIREAARRTIGKRHYDVQLLAGRALLHGTIAEMATGEGKTLAATLAVCSSAATGAAVHVVTVNDYLAERDAEDNAPLYHFFGFKVGLVKQDMPIDERRAQYEKPIVYVSNKELTFDYLKDRIALRGTLDAHVRLRRLQGGRTAASSQAILRGLQVAIVDEADSVFIDEARTPLIISETRPDDLDPVIYQQALDIARQLEQGSDFLIGKHRDLWLTARGEGTVQILTSELGSLWASELWRKDLVQKALSASHLFLRDQQYIVAENKVQIVDEFTGRVMPDRTWERGLHQMIEAKEGCEITGQRRTLSQITYQRFFGRYVLLAGMTGTAKEVEPELKRTYDLSAVRIPTHKPTRRRRLPDRVHSCSSDRWDDVAQRAADMAKAGRAVLVGTRSVEASEILAGLLAVRGVDHAILNARQDHDEAKAVSQAGRIGRITVATNMAGRGTDIKLDSEVEANGGLHVILTEFHESARVDRQLFGRSARQGDPGSVEAIVSLDDELFRRFAPMLTQIGWSIWLAKGWLAAGAFRMLVRYAQNRSERISRRIRLDTIKRDRQWQTALGFVGGKRE